MSEIAMDQPTTETLVSRAQEGDNGAFDQLVERYRPRLERRITARMGAAVRARLGVDDVLQETFACAVESLERFTWRGEDSFYSWLGGIAEHVISNAARKKSWKELALPRDVADAGTSPSGEQRRHERFDRLENAIKNLDPDQREALVLARFEGLKIREIATRMNRSSNAVCKLLARALKQLKKNFGDTESLHLPARSMNIKERRDAE